MRKKLKTEPDDSIGGTFQQFGDAAIKNGGLTKREFFAAIFINASMSNASVFNPVTITTGDIKSLPEMCLAMADLFIQELNK